jgi:hypothetical protein
MPNLKKVTLGILGLLIIATIYYFTSGSEQLTIQMKKQVDAEFASLQTQGFTIEGKEVSKKKEHFVISLNEPKKVATYLNAQGAQVSPEDIEILKGLKIGIDINYLSNTYSAASFDMYPLALPTALTSAVVDAEDKKALKQLEKMIEKKTLLVHVDVNKLGTGFKGYVKDINEPIDADSKITLIMTALKFTGDIKNNKFSSIKQTLKNFSIHSDDDEINMQINHLTSNYAITGSTKYDYTTDYLIEEVLVTAKDMFKLRVINMSMDSDAKVSNNLAAVNAQTKVDSVHFTQGQKTSTLESLIFDMKVKNLDMHALEKLETIDPENKKELLTTFQKLISHGIHFAIPNFSVKNVVYENQKLEGFKLSSSFDIDKSLDLTALEQNPIAAIGAMDANLHLTLSNQLLEFIAKQPKAMLVMMLFQPKDINGQKVYKIELKDGTLSVNGKQAM